MTARELPVRALEILREQGPLQLLRITQSFLSGLALPIAFYRLRHRVRQWRYPTQYTSADPFKIISVDPSDVHRLEQRPAETHGPNVSASFDSKGRFHKWENVGRVIEGDWDQGVTQQFPFEQSARRHFVEGVPWEHTDYFKEKVSMVEDGGTWRGCENKSEVLARFRRWERLYHRIKTEGYRRSPPDGIFRWKNHFDELTVCIGRDGRIIRSSSGTHRLCISKLLQLDSIPARVLIRHRDWESLRRDVANRSDPDLGELIHHPDLADCSRSV